MKTSVKWTEGRQFVAETGSGHSVVIDGPPEHGGRNTGPRPMEMLLMGLGACTSFDVLEILEKARASVSDCVASVEAERADEVVGDRAQRLELEAEPDARPEHQRQNAPAEAGGWLGARQRVSLGAWRLWAPIRPPRRSAACGPGSRRRSAAFR